MERYNLRSGSLAAAVISSSSEVKDSGRTEESRLADYAVRDTARLSAEDVAPNLKLCPLPRPLRQRHFRPK